MNNNSNTTRQSLEELRADALRLLLDYRRATPDQRTPLLRQLAEVVVEARGHFLTESAVPDWKGLTYAYRQWHHELYEDARVPKDERASLQAAVRYHTGAVLRQRLTPEQLDELGMMQKTPRDRSRERREGRNAVTNALLHNRMPGGEMLALSAAFSLISTIEGETFDQLGDDDRETVTRSLRDLERRIERLKGKVERIEERTNRAVVAEPVLTRGEGPAKRRKNAAKRSKASL